MYAYLNGMVTQLEPHVAVIECGGVGYLCHITTMTQSRLQLGERTKLYVFLYVREDAMELYGFHSMEEKNCFLLLTGISGVGMKAGLAILSTLSPEKFALAVLSGDEKALTNAPGIGKKLAQRIILELKDQLKKQYASGKQEFGSLPEAVVTEASDAVGEAVLALQVLGYTAAEATAALRGENLEGKTVEECIRYALKNLAKGSYT